MHSPYEIHEQRQKMLVAKIAYLREEKILAEMSINNAKQRDDVVADLVKLIARSGRELGGHTDRAWHPCETCSSEASAIDTGNQGGC